MIVVSRLSGPRESPAIAKWTYRAYQACGAEGGGLRRAEVAEPWAGGRPTGRPGAASGAGTAALPAPLGALSAHRHHNFRGHAAMKASHDAMSAVSIRTPHGRKLVPCC